MVTSSCLFFFFFSPPATSILQQAYHTHYQGSPTLPKDPTTGTVIFSFLPASFVLSPHITALPVNEHRSNQKRFAMGHLYAEAEK